MLQKAELDILYQRAVDTQAHSLLECSTTEIINYPDFGDFSVKIDGQIVSGGFQHHSFETGTHHIYFQLHLQTRVFFYKKYLSGIKLDSTGMVSLLSDEEIAEYD